MIIHCSTVSTVTVLIVTRRATVSTVTVVIVTCGGTLLTVSVAAQGGLCVWSGQFEVEITSQVFNPHGGVLWEHGLTALQLLLQVHNIKLTCGRRDERKESGIRNRVFTHPDEISRNAHN